MQNKPIFFHIDSPPLKTKGFGLSVLMYNILQALDNKNNKVITYLNYQNVTEKEIFADADWETILIKPVTFWLNIYKLPQIIQRGLLFLGFLFKLPSLLKDFNKEPENPILFCVGASGESLIKAYIIQFLAKNPLWLYIVDDLEKINELVDNRFEKFVIQTFLAPVIASTSRLIVISEGLKLKYKLKYNKHSDILLPCFPPVNKSLIRKTTLNKDSFYFVFSGGLSFLYNTTLKSFHDTITRLNNDKNRLKEYKLIIQTYSSKIEFQNLFPDETYVEYHTSPTRDSFQETYQVADCFIIPYSFEKKHHDLVSTSFPQKVAELIQLERPLLVIGPMYSSVVEFFEKNQLDFLVNDSGADNNDALVLKIDALKGYTNNNEIYSKIYQNNFSPSAVKLVLNKQY